MKTAALALSALVLAGCAGMQADANRDMQRLTAGAIGCPPAEIIISDHRKFGWNATCRGREFVCSFLDSVQCKEALAPAPARPQ